MILACNDWAKSLDSGVRIEVDVFDFSKAFDPVPAQEAFGRDQW